MNKICISHKTSESLVYQFNMPTENGYVRSCACIFASPSVSYRDILNEFYSKDNGYLETVTTLSNRTFVSLSRAGFHRIATGLSQREELKPEDLFLERLAKELIASRDFEFAGGHSNKNHKFKDYWPKD